MSVRAEDLTLEGFPKWVVQLMEDCTIHQATNPIAPDNHRFTVFVPRAKYDRVHEFNAITAHDAHKSITVALARFRAAITRQAACTIWETRDKHGKILPA